MPTDTILVVVAVLTVFGFFAATLAFAEATWQRGPRRSLARRR